MAFTSRPVLRATLMGSALLAVSACDQFDLDLRNTGTGIDTTDAVRSASAPRPEADARGIITYPNYQVAVARRGDTVSDVAARIGLPADELARHNGIGSDIALRNGELLALPRRVEPAAGATGTIQPAEQIDITTLAGDAIQRAEPAAAAAPAAVQTGPEPVRHKVERGETAYSISRLYNVSVKSLAEWNGLGTDLSLREGQLLLIPVPDENTRTAAAAPRTSEPGEGSPTPAPPSASKPLPDEKVEPAKPLPSPDLSTDRSVQAQLAFPAKGDIIRGYKKGSNEGIDIAAAAGSPVVAAEAGTVAAITRDTDQVPILVIRHPDNLLSVYANIDKIGIKKGDSVKRGQQVAVVRNGKPSFLHFEVRQGFESVDPVPFLN